MIRHAKGFEIVAKKFEKNFLKNHPNASILWTMPIKRNKDGSAGGRVKVSQNGYNPKTYLIVAEKHGAWYTL